MKVYSELDLNLPDLWFTGQEWADGTANKVLRAQYDAAQKAMRKHEDSIYAFKVVRKPDPLSFDDNKGLSPLEICRRAMRSR